jgi:hypothetical protein
MEEAEGIVQRRWLIVVVPCVLTGMFGCRDNSLRQELRETSAPTIIRQPVNFAQRTFDPARPPSDMPPLSRGEEAVCDSDFLSSASVRGMTRQLDATHATLTVTQIKMTLQLDVTIWVPTNASQHVLDHEEGHRQISDYYYQTADKLAARIAAAYRGRQVDVTGADLDAESNKILNQLAAEITAEYNRELNPGPTQQLYDTITDHSRNGVVANDAVAHAIKNVIIESP